MVKFGYELRAQSNYAGRGINFYLFHHNGSGGEAILKARPNEATLEVHPITHNGAMLDRSFVLPLEWAQELFDDLYQAGFRPTQRIDDPGAVNRHLEDMRTIAFAKLNIPQPAGK